MAPPPRAWVYASMLSVAVRSMLLGGTIIMDVVESHGGLTTPLPRNSFNQPLDPQQPGKFGGMTNYYDDGCVPGCDSCLHHGATGAYPSGADGCQLLPGGCYYGEDNAMNMWAAPYNVRCTVNGKPVGRGVYNVTVPGSDTLPDHARTWNRNATAVNTNPLIGDWGRFAPWRAPGAANIGDPCKLSRPFISPRGAKLHDDLLPLAYQVACCAIIATIPTTPPAHRFSTAPHCHHSKAPRRRGERVP